MQIIFIDAVPALFTRLPRNCLQWCTPTRASHASDNTHGHTHAHRTPNLPSKLYSTDTFQLSPSTLHDRHVLRDSPSHRRHKEHTRQWLVCAQTGVSTGHRRRVTVKVATAAHSLSDHRQPELSLSANSRRPTLRTGYHLPYADWHPLRYRERTSFTQGERGTDGLRAVSGDVCANGPGRIICLIRRRR